MPDPDQPVQLLDLVAQWRPDWLAVLVLAALGVVHLRARLALHAAGQPWPRSRDAAFAAGLALGAWVTCGVLQARGRELLWVWTTQSLVLLLVVPALLLAAQPLALARAASGPRSPLPRLVGSRFVRLAAHPALSPLWVPVTAALLFFGGVGELAVRSEHLGWVLHVLLLAVGALVALPLLDREDTRTSLAVGAALAVGVVELLVDAVPGIVLRLETHLTIPWFGLDRPAWSPSWLADQQSAGGVLWTVAEVLDLPFLVLTVLQWIRVERAEAHAVDLALDRAELAAADPGTGPTTPWWHLDPDLRERWGPPPPAGRDERT